MDYKQIKSFEDACQSLGLDASTVIPSFEGFPEKERKGMQSHAKLVIIAKAINNGWVPNWASSHQYKYYAWFWMKKDVSSPSGFGFSDSDYGDSHTDTDVGSRLCYESREKALYAAETFQELYADYFLN